MAGPRAGELMERAAGGVEDWSFLEARQVRPVVGRVFRVVRRVSRW